MNDTPEHVKQKQMKIWLSKPVEERLRLTLTMNDELYGFWNAAKKNKAKANPGHLPGK